MASRYEKEDSKRRILSACVQLFIEKGYQKTTTVEILKKAGVTPSTFYNIYHTKGSILTELTEFMFVLRPCDIVKHCSFTTVRVTC